ncbi:DNA cytosine methyltransferase [Pseudomonas kribbensis]|uniref:DNA cytosine methyltransferase n=1 Tax=Pseudomonas kribbensis TaxID=1628086 RepID=UPI001F10CDF8|nr:DNA cytosine methyltransferase [Pseudomonas kribbensis]
MSWLFSQGAGGGILGGHLLGWRTVCAVERDAYAAQILAQRQTDGLLPPFPIWSDVCSFDGRPWRDLVDVVSGGFPCQDISVAGNGLGIAGSRSGLWRQTARIIDEVRPRYVELENSPLLVGRGLAVVLGDLAEMGHDARWGVIGAADLGAPHQRDRIWLIAEDTRQTVAKPVASMAKGSSPAALTRRSGADRSNDRLDHAVMALDGGHLNPEWAEWLMGWPIGWTGLKPLATDKFHLWQQEHSNNCQELKMCEAA